MRRITLTFALTLWAGHANASVLFTPDIFTFQFKATFNDTATDTFCWQCTDADPSNDLHAMLQVLPELSGDWMPFRPDVLGQLNLLTTATNFLGLDANITVHAKLIASGSQLPESLLKPSVSKGALSGRLFGVDDGELELVVLECCDGFVNGVEFRQAFFPSTPFLPPPGQLVRDSLEEEIFFPEQIEYTPVVPEPASLILFGSGFAAVVLQRRRSLQRRSSEMP